MTEETALTVHDADYRNGDLAPFDTLLDQDKIVLMGDNLMGVHPEAQAIGKVGMRTVAQLALVTGANPLPGTNGIHAWKDSKGKLCIQFGIGFWRGKVDEQGGIIWHERPRPMTDEERVKWSVTENEIAWICMGTTWDAVRELRRQEKELGGELSLKEAREILYKEGVGIVGTETWGNGSNYKEQKTGRPLAFTASERCERDLCRKLAPIFQPAANRHPETRRLMDSGPKWEELQPHQVVGVIEPPDDITEGEFLEIEDEISTVDDATLANEELESLVADTRAWLQEKVKNNKVVLGFVCDAVAMTKLYTAAEHAESALEKFPLPNGVELKIDRKTVLTGEGSLKMFDWLVYEKLTTVDEEE